MQLSSTIDEQAQEEYSDEELRWEAIQSAAADFEVQSRLHRLRQNNEPPQPVDRQALNTTIYDDLQGHMMRTEDKDDAEEEAHIGMFNNTNNIFRPIPEAVLRTSPSGSPSPQQSARRSVQQAATTSRAAASSPVQFRRPAPRAAPSTASGYTDPNQYTEQSDAELLALADRLEQQHQSQQRTQTQTTATQDGYKTPTQSGSDMEKAITSLVESITKRVTSPAGKGSTQQTSTTDLEEANSRMAKRLNGELARKLPTSVVRSLALGTPTSMAMHGTSQSEQAAHQAHAWRPLLKPFITSKHLRESATN